MRRALVTGATGGLGLALTAALIAQGYAVRATGRRKDVADRLEAMGADTVMADIADDPKAAMHLCRDIDVVFHAAALSSPWGDDDAFERINVAATQALLRAAQDAGCDGLVFVSTPSIYARLHDQIGLTENDPPARHPLSAYARTKLTAERCVLAANARGFATCAIRPRALVGPDDAVLLPRLLRVIGNGWFPAPRGGRALIELTDVRDAAQALILADRHRGEIGGRAFNISGGRPVTVRAMAEDLAEALGRPLRVVPAPWPAMYVGAAVVEALAKLAPGRPEPPLTPYSVATLAFSQTFDLTVARRDLGYAPQHDANLTALDVARHWAAR